MGASATPAVILLGLLTWSGFCQTVPSRVGVPDDPLASRTLKISGMPMLEPPARDYQKFFDDVQGMRTSLLSKEARKALDLTDEELRSLADVTSDLVAASFQGEVKPQVFESRMEVAESGFVSASLEEKMRDMQNQWAKTILDHVQRLKADFGQEDFQRLDEFIHSGKPMFGSLIISGAPVVEPPARDYQKFFDEVKDLGKLPISDEARKALHLTDQELHSLLAVTTDLAAESKVEAASATPSPDELRDRQLRWAQTILDYAQQLRAAFGEKRFERVDEFIHSGNSMFASGTNAAPERKSN
jgi:hypothetical protein